MYIKQEINTHKATEVTIHVSHEFRVSICRDSGDEEKFGNKKHIYEVSLFVCCLCFKQEELNYMYFSVTFIIIIYLFAKYYVDY